MSFEKDLLLAFSIVLFVELEIFEDFFSSFLFGVHPFILFCLIYQMFFKKHNLFHLFFYFTDKHHLRVVRMIHRLRSCRG